MGMKPFRSLHAQRGTSLFGLAVIAVIVSFVAYVGMQVLPAINEYLTIRRAVTQIMKGAPTNPIEIRTAFDRQKDVEYSIASITGKDLEIVQTGDKLTTRYAYSREIEIAGPVFLLLKFDGSATSGSSTP